MGYDCCKDRICKISFSLEIGLSFIRVKLINSFSNKYHLHNELFICVMHMNS